MTSRLRVLVTDDNPVDQRVGVYLLKAQGHFVSVAGNGHEAILALELGTYDLVLMDVEMPELNGLAATRAIRSHEDMRIARTTIVGVTASSNRDECLEAGMDGFLPKPLNATVVRETIGSVRRQTPALSHLQP